MDGSSVAPIPFELNGSVLMAVSSGEVEIPPFPAVAVRLQSMLKEGAGFPDIAEVVTQDQALTAFVLRCASGARFATPVSTVGQALSRIGTKELVAFAFALGLKGAAEKQGPLERVRRELWHRGLAASSLCRQLAGKHGLVPEEAQVCGLLSEFGAVAAASILEQVFESEPPQTPLTLDQWRHSIARYDRMLAPALVQQWDMPSPIREVVLRSDPAQAGDYAPMIALVEEAMVDIDRLFRRNGRGDELPEETRQAFAATERQLSRMCDASTTTAPIEAPGEEDWIDIDMEDPVDLVPSLEGIQALVGKEEKAFGVVEVRGDRIVLAGEQRLPENLITKVQLCAGDDRLEVVTLVKSTRPMAEHFAVETDLFCSTVELTHRVRDLINRV